MIRRSRPNITIRHGSTLVEIVVSIVVVSMLLTLVARTTVGRSRQRRMLEQEQIAVQEAANIMERIFVRPWGDLQKQAWFKKGAGTVVQYTLRAVPATVPDPLLRLSAIAEVNLPDGRAEVRVEDVSGFTGSKRVTVHISWSTSVGTRQEKRLVAWKYPLGRAE